LLEAVLVTDWRGDVKLLLNDTTAKLMSDTAEEVSLTSAYLDYNALSPTKNQDECSW
jgi:hypothetical protein